MIQLEVNKKLYSNFTSIQVLKSLDSIAGAFYFNATVDEFGLFPIDIGSRARVLIDGNPIVTGFIDEVSVSHSVNEHTINISGNDKTIDVVETTLAENAISAGGVRLDRLIEKALSQSGITGISVINNVPDLVPFRDNDFEEAQTSETVFDYIERYARKAQAVITSDGNGDIVITRAGKESSGSTLYKRKNNSRNNILSSVVSYTNTQRFNKYIVKSQFNPSSDDYNSGQPVEDLTNRTEQAIDSSIRENRILRIFSESSSDNDNLLERAKWEANIRRVQGSQYTCVIQGVHFPNTKNICNINKLIRVDDEYSRISPNTELLVNSVDFNLDAFGGTTTTLGLIEKDAYTLQANNPELQSRTASEGVNYDSSNP